MPPSDEVLRGQLLTILRHPRLPQLVQQNLPQQGPLFMWRHQGELGQIEQEIFTLLNQHVDLADRNAERFAWWSIQQMLADAHATDNDEGVEKAVDDFLNRFEAELTAFHVLFPLQGVKSFRPSIEIENCTFGALSDLVPGETQMGLPEQAETASDVWALADVEASKEEQAARVARHDCRAALQILATLAFRSRSVSNPRAANLSSVGYVLDDEMTPIHFSRSHFDLWEFRVQPELLKKGPTMDYAEGPIPWTELPEEAELRSTLREAYRRLGNAARSSEDPEVAIPLAVSAVEHLLAGDREHNKSKRAAGRMIVAAARTDSHFIWPLKLYAWFQDRHEILHDLSSSPWSPKTARRTLWLLYGILDTVAHLIVSEDLQTKEKLFAELAEPSAISEATEWVDGQIERFEELRDDATTSAYRRQMGEIVGVWGDIKKAINQG